MHLLRSNSYPQVINMTISTACVKYMCETIRHVSYDCAYICVGFIHSPRVQFSLNKSESQIIFRSFQFFIVIIMIFFNYIRIYQCILYQLGTSVYSTSIITIGTNLVLPFIDSISYTIHIYEISTLFSDERDHNLGKMIKKVYLEKCSTLW